MTDTHAQRPEPVADPDIHTRVCIDSMLGPYDAKLDPTHRWNGWLSPYFTLDTVRQLAARTQEMAEEDGFDCVDTIHVIDGDTDSDGEPRAVVVHIRWQYLGEGAESAASIIQPNDEGLYGVGGWEWTWHFASWTCACGTDAYWHVETCENCGAARDGQLQEQAPAGQPEPAADPKEIVRLRERVHHAAARVRADPDSTNPEWRAALADLTESLDQLAAIDPVYRLALQQADATDD
ncbi:hypothetical protein BX257_4057 [Streptomyces sp. 3212.3]|uniref:hypothetical protein n=1 Tax=Streptomyces sp. 3212.3 TaxID=1938846 RepID=UPI000E2538F4|nr:hypothetical protein [Streptomyces sp. 3212.3]REE61478.1 hypothetical protein BX257_4057 [Streptomyces sp. 3212.3]